MDRSLVIPVKLNLIQSIRLVHAIAECGFPVYIAPEYISRFSALQARFPLSFATGKTETISLPDVAVRHDTPATSVGRIVRPLIFPHCIPDWCRREWIPQEKRDIDVSFCGLLTGKRRTFLESWFKQANGQDANLDMFKKSSPVKEFLQKFFPPPMDRSEQSYHFPLGRVVLWSSTRGRVFPVKSWDEEYFRILLRSKFVLCPNGDYVWSYRFFEAAMCGAIPIVEDACEAYQGFHYLKSSDTEFAWSSQAALANYALCVERITVPRKDFVQEIQRLCPNLKPS